ncbi:mucin-5B-like, partial [Rana temporaria]|uniref:mucin-5B-like n=1 Tax=Rana temporaria TaxID=8407 RepID=UPI001AAD36E2
MSYLAGVAELILMMKGAPHHYIHNCNNTVILHTESYAHDWCSKLNSGNEVFSACHSVVNPTVYYERCLYDACLCKRSEDCLCAVFSNYIRACTERGIRLQNWREHICDKYVKECPTTMNFQYNVDTCQPTCMALSEADESCLLSFVPTEGCVCNQDLYMNEKECTYFCTPVTQIQLAVGLLSADSTELVQAGSGCAKILTLMSGSIQSISHFLLDVAQPLLDSDAGSEVEDDSKMSLERGRNTGRQIGIHVPQVAAYCQVVSSGNDEDRGDGDDDDATWVPDRAKEETEDCKPPMVYFNCSLEPPGATGIECLESCQRLDIDCYSVECVSGCVCPDNLLADGKGGCVSMDSCSCMFNNVVYEHMQTTTIGCNMCTCKNRKWECEHDVPMGVCKVYGDGNYETFDEKRYRFSGECEYVIAQDCCGEDKENSTFKVISENTQCSDTGLTCAKTIIVILEGYELLLSDGGVEVINVGDGEETPYYIKNNSLNLIIKAKNGIILVWDKKTGLSIKVPEQFQHKVCGLCGNYDGNSNNDFNTRGQCTVEDILEFGNSWKMKPTCNDVKEIIEPCDVNPLRKPWAQRQCSVILSDTFKACHSQVDPISYYEACVKDSCACDEGGDCECFCTSLAQYAQACLSHCVCVEWRTPTRCPAFCEYYNEHEDECQWHYRPCGPHCMKSCRNPSGVCSSDEVKVEGCYPVCPPEKPFFEEVSMKCVDVCGCYDNTGKYYNPGDQIPSCDPCVICTGTTTSTTTPLSTTTGTTTSTTTPLSTTTGTTTTTTTPLSTTTGTTTSTTTPISTTTGTTRQTTTPLSTTTGTTTLTTTPLSTTTGTTRPTTTPLSTTTGTTSSTTTPLSTTTGITTSTTTPISTTTGTTRQTTTPLSTTTGTTTPTTTPLSTTTGTTSSTTTPLSTTTGTTTSTTTPLSTTTGTTTSTTTPLS